MIDPYEFRPWCPKGVQYFITAGASNYIGLINKHTVLKFPLVSPIEKDSYPPRGLESRRSVREAAVKGLQVELQIIRILGQRPRIIRFVGAHEDGLLLEYLPNGSVERYLRDFGSVTPPNQRLRWATEAVEGLAYVHEKNVLHCDFVVGNLLVDNDGTIKLCDFQGRLLGPDGAVILNGRAAESDMSSMPRLDRQHCDRKSDMFAFGTALYYMMTGQSPFQELDTADDEAEINRRFQERDFHPLDQLQSDFVARKCWEGSYPRAAEIVHDLEKLDSSYFKPVFGAHWTA